jgi:hypothetical protein
MNFLQISTHFKKIQQIAYTSEDTLLHRSRWKEMRARNWVPRPWEAAGSPEIQRLRRRSRSGKGSGSRACSPSVYWRSWLGRRGCRRGGSATAGGGSGLQREVAHGRQCATLGGSTGPRERVRRSAGGESERCCKLTGGSGGLRRSGARRGRMATLK